MRLFVFGLGYTAERFVDTFVGRFTNVSCTVRRAERLNTQTCVDADVYTFNATVHAADIEQRVSEADAILVSVPPARFEDPVLSVFGQLLRRSAARRIVYLSSIGVYGDHGGAWIDELTSAVPNTDRGKARRRAEVEWRDTVGDRLAILRLAGIYGLGRDPFVNLRAGRARRIVKPGQVLNRIHVDDAGRAITRAFEISTGGTWNVCDDEPAPPQDVIAYAASLMNVRPPPEEDFSNCRRARLSLRIGGQDAKGALPDRLPTSKSVVAIHGLRSCHRLRTA